MIIRSIFLNSRKLFDISFHFFWRATERALNFKYYHNKDIDDENKPVSTKKSTAESPFSIEERQQEFIRIKSLLEPDFPKLTTFHPFRTVVNTKSSQTNSTLSTPIPKTQHSDALNTG